MTRAIMLYVADEDAENIRHIGKQKGLPLATMARSLLIQKLREIAPISACKQEMDAKDTPIMGCHDD